METVNNNPAIAKVLTFSLVKPLFVFIMPLGLELVTSGWELGVGSWELGDGGRGTGSKNVRRTLNSQLLAPNSQLNHYPLFTIHYSLITRSNSISIAPDLLKRH
jgi:hypothetical protein